MIGLLNPLSTHRSYHENVMFLFTCVLTLRNTLFPELQFCVKIVHGGHGSLTLVSIFEKHL